MFTMFPVAEPGAPAVAVDQSVQAIVLANAAGVIARAVADASESWRVF